MSKITREEKVKPIIEVLEEHIGTCAYCPICDDNLEFMQEKCMNGHKMDWSDQDAEQPPQLDSNIEEALGMITTDYEMNLKSKVYKPSTQKRHIDSIKQHIQALTNENERLNKSDASKEQSSIDYYNEMKNLEVKIKQYEDVIDKVIYAWKHRLFEESMSVIELQEIFNELKQIQGKE